MMRVLQLAPLSQARVWFAETATSAIIAKGVTRATAPPSPRSDASTDGFDASLEVLVPRGARAEYGLLGCAFVPLQSGELQIEVPHTDMDGPEWPCSLAGLIDVVRLGLPNEYASAVVSALMSAVAWRVPSGVLRITEAAHGLVGSSPGFFSKLGVAAIEVALLGDTIADDRMIQALRDILIT